VLPINRTVSRFENWTLPCGLSLAQRAAEITVSSGFAAKLVTDLKVDVSYGCFWLRFAQDELAGRSVVRGSLP